MILYLDQLGFFFDLQKAKEPKEQIKPRFTCGTSTQVASFFSQHCGFCQLGHCCGENENNHPQIYLNLIRIKDFDRLTTGSCLLLLYIKHRDSFNITAESPPELSMHRLGPVNCSGASQMDVCDRISDPFCRREGHPQCRGAVPASESLLGGVIAFCPAAAQRPAVEFSAVLHHKPC